MRNNKTGALVPGKGMTAIKIVKAMLPRYKRVAILRLG
jgi:hypothetical protein